MISSSGEFTAYAIAIASSIPVSTSKITFFILYLLMSLQDGYGFLECWHRGLSTLFSDGKCSYDICKFGCFLQTLPADECCCKCTCKCIACCCCVDRCHFACLNSKRFGFPRHNNSFTP